MSDWENLAGQVIDAATEVAIDATVDATIGAINDHIISEDSYIGGNKIGAGLGVLGAVGIGAFGLSAPIAVPALILGGVLGAGVESGTKSTARGINRLVGNVSEGVRNIFGGIANFFKSEEDFFLSGLDKLENGYISDAKLDFDKAVELNEWYVGGHLGRGLVYLNKDDYKNAQKHFLKVLNIDSKETLSLYYLACIESELGNNEMSVDYATRAIRISPNDIDYYLIRINSLIELKKLDKALNDCNKVLSIENDNVIALFTKAQILIDQQNFVKAIDTYNELINFVEDSDKINILYTRGCLFFEIENYNAAILDFSAVLEVLPENYDTYFQRGATYFELDLFEKALLDFTKAVQLNGDEPSYYYYQGITYFELNKFKLAKYSFLKVIELSPDSIEGYYFLGYVYLKLKQPKKALKILHQAKEIDSSSPVINVRIAEAYEMQENYKKAIDNLNLIIESSTLEDNKDLSVEINNKINSLQEKDKTTPWWKKKKYWQSITIISVVSLTIFTGYFLSNNFYNNGGVSPSKININENKTK
jgi:tetratricopeptide (TPR) repeat protein